jgi:hypothetical protein
MRRSFTLAVLLLTVTPALAGATGATVTLRPGPLTVSAPALGKAFRVSGGWTLALGPFTVVNGGHDSGWKVEIQAQGTNPAVAVFISLPAAVDVYDPGGLRNAAVSEHSQVKVNGGFAVVAFAAPHTGLGTFRFSGARLYIQGAAQPSALSLHLTITSGP